MSSTSPFEVDEQLIAEALSDRLDRIAPRKDLWQKVQSEAFQPRPRFRIGRLARLVVVAGLLALAAMLALLQPWSGDEATLISPAMAVAKAYEGLISVDTAHIRIETENNQGLRVLELRQVDVVNKIGYTKMWTIGLERVDKSIFGSSFIRVWPADPETEPRL